VEAQKMVAEERTRAAELEAELQGIRERMRVREKEVQLRSLEKQLQLLEAEQMEGDAEPLKFKLPSPPLNRSLSRSNQEAASTTLKLPSHSSNESLSRSNEDAALVTMKSTNVDGLTETLSQALLNSRVPLPEPKIFRGDPLEFNA
jgi:hypothetical protein